jgi:hypothetical protein
MVSFIQRMRRIARSLRGLENTGYISQEGADPGSWSEFGAHRTDEKRGNLRSSSRALAQSPYVSG